MKSFLKNFYKILIAIALAIAVFWLAHLVYWPLGGGLNEKTEFVISKGDSSAKVARLLAEQNLIRNRFIFITYAVATGQEKKFQAGRYQLSSGMNIPQIVGMFANGLAESNDVAVTIPEGFNVFEIDKKLSESNLIKPGVFFAQARHLEGFLFPDTYRFDQEETLQGIIKKMQANFDEKIKEKPNRQQLIVASLLEKEVQQPEEMALVAGIIYKRLSLGMLLQIDATITYGVCLDNSTVKQSTGNYGFCDVSKVGVANFLNQDSPYNSYRRPGLPPGPISNPGQEAIKAAMHPAASDYLFYLTSRSDGQTIFSRTSAEHERNRAKYLK